LSRSLSQQVGILTFGRVLAYGVAFFVPLVNVRMLTVEHYGYYGQFWLVFETLTPLLILGMPRSLLYYFPRAESREAKAVYVTQTLFYLCAMSLVAVGIYTVMGRVLGEGLGALVRAFYLRLCFFTFFMMISQYMDSLFVAERKVVHQSAYHVVSTAVQSIVVIVSATISRSVDVIVWSLAWFSLAKFLFAVGYTWYVYRPSITRISWSTMRDQLSFSIPLGLAGIALLLVSQTDKFIINRFMGREEFAIYRIGAAQIPFVGIIRTSINNVTFPLMSKYQKAGDNMAILDLWQRALLRTAVMFFPIFVFLMLSARSFVVILYTETYKSATPIFMIYLLLFLRMTVETGSIIQVFKKTAFIARVFAGGFVVNLAMSLGLFEVMGREGVPVATVITMYAVNVINLIYCSRLLGVSVAQLFPTAAVLKRLAVALLPGVALWMAYRAIDVDHVIELAVAGVAYIGVYFALCAWTGFITREDIKSLLGRRTSI
jgi:O-antigen/teichoic acid export membrane protein